VVVQPALGVPLAGSAVACSSVPPGLSKVRQGPLHAGATGPQGGGAARAVGRQLVPPL
jgi:hypothetical protein